MKKIRFIIGNICAAAMIFVSITGCGAWSRQREINKGPEDEGQRDTLFQVSLLQGLTFGDYHGSVPVSELMKRGDIGIGTFDGLNGELIALDGVVYRAAADGSVETVGNDELIPFSNVTFFDEDEVLEIGAVADIDELKALLDNKIKELGVNRFYMVRIDGDFTTMNVRSEYSQKEPYEPLAKVLETDQTFFDYENIEGTVVALYCPPYMDSLNATGWHLHFISGDRLYGGHVLGLSFDSATAKLDYTDGFEMLLPENELFNGFDLTIDQSEDIKKVETDAESKDN